MRILDALSYEGDICCVHWIDPRDAGDISRDVDWLPPQGVEPEASGR